MSDMTNRDKAVEYERIAEYLRKHGWIVVCESRLPNDGALREIWRHPFASDCDLMTAYRVECYKDAPKQGERMAQNLETLNRVIDDKAARAAGHGRPIANTAQAVKDVGAVFEKVLCDHQTYFVIVLDEHTGMMPCVGDMLQRPPAERKRAADVLRTWAARVEAGKAREPSKA